MGEETAITLREYMDMRFTTLIDSMRNMEKRIEQLGQEVQTALASTHNAISRAEHDVLTEKVQKNENDIANIKGRAYGIGIMFSVVSVLLSAILTLFLHFLPK